MSVDHERICVETNKVYDWCYRRFEHTFEAEVMLPGSGRDVQLITCEITDVHSQQMSSTVGAAGVATIVLAKIVDYTLTFWELNAQGELVVHTPNGTLDKTVVFPESFSLCAPDGTSISDHTTFYSCEVVSVTPPLPAETGADKKVKVVLRFILCQSVQSLAPVKVCIPLLGFCTPKTQCEPLNTPCPPVFPPDCGANLCPPVAG